MEYRKVEGEKVRIGDKKGQNGTHKIWCKEINCKKTTPVRERNHHKVIYATSHQIPDHAHNG